MIVLASVITFLFVSSLLFVAFYGIHHGLMTFFALRRKDGPVLPEIEDFPDVTVQVTIYNEGEVIEHWGGTSDRKLESIDGT